MATTTIESLEARVDKLERQRGTDDESVRRARLAVESTGRYSAVWKWVDPDYYTWSLEKRAHALNAPTIDILCKSLLLENKKVVNPSETNPRFVLLVLQYAHTLDHRKLVQAIRSLQPKDSRSDVNQFDFRLASDADNDRITGYRHNSVTPFGLLMPPMIVMAESIVQYKFFWMGGGHVHLKLGMAVTDFRKALQPVVADISQPKEGGDDASGDD